MMLLLSYRVKRAFLHMNGNITNGVMLESSIFEAKFASGSFAWKSILFARKLVEKDARWRVGNGKSIRIFHDSWLPNSQEGKVISPQNFLAPDSTVDTLIDAHTGWWNSHLIDLCFYPPEAALIKSLPLCSVPQPDILIWPKENSGIYSVKSGYKSLMDSATLDTIRPSISATQKSFWKSIWNLNVPGKIKHFLWRACTNSLPSKENLKKRAIPIDPTCHLCSRENESILHALWGCEKVQTVWATDFGWVDKNTAAAGSFSDLVQLIREKPHTFPLFSITAWSLWHHRNKSRLQVPSLPLVQIGVFAQDYLRSFKTRVSQASHSTGSGHPSQKHWLPPPPECFKANFDGAMFNESDEAGLGVVIRNSRGQVMVALSEKIKKPPSVVALELLAARRAAVLVSETGFQNSVFEGDSLAVVKSLQGSGMENSAVGHILKDTLSIVSLLKSFSFSHVNRQGNAVAHALAQRARLSFPLQVWMESVPPDLNAVLLADLHPSV
ncbi:hypothetical protein SO802_028742 [Lithocarpus litseifolius]|uniref:Reverse transcriptase zinc-binding domain-containing protein n=1 Tax=Lithocarpus litseifolius TaxID=425828 RepID=A0AAW2BT08_9ROSI